MPPKLTFQVFLMVVLASVICDVLSMGTTQHQAGMSGGILSLLSGAQFTGLTGVMSAFVTPISWVIAIWNMVSFNYPIFHHEIWWHNLVWASLILMQLAWLISFGLALVRGVPAGR